MLDHEVGDLAGDLARTVALDERGLAHEIGDEAFVECRRVVIAPHPLPPRKRKPSGRSSPSGRSARWRPRPAAGSVLNVELQHHTP